MPKEIWRMEGEEIGSCNCAWGCPCQFNALPTTGQCEGMGVAQIRTGHYGGVSLDGLRFSFMAWFPGAMHEGNGIMQVVIDESASSKQREALEEIVSGQVAA